MAAFMVDGLPAFDETAFNTKNTSFDEIKRILQFVIWRCEALNDWQHDSLNQLFVDLAEALQLKIRDVLGPVFVAISGKPVSPPLFDSMAWIGPDMSRARLRHALGVLGGVSKKQLKKLEKDYASLQG
jgi:glutamyl-tRNA synthetase